MGDFGEADDTRYREGIYVGYRYFDSAGKSPLFPFGYGLSFTEFELSDEKTEVNCEEVTVSVKVKNIGSRPGKEIVQIYVSKPEVVLDHPFQELACFAKSDLLAPEAEQTLTMSFAMSALASYDPERESWILI